MAFPGLLAKEIQREIVAPVERRKVKPKEKK
jgi:hypothetical protein